MAKVETERFFGKKGIIIMIRDGNKFTSAIFKDKKNADKFNRNNPADVKKLVQLAKKTKFPKAIDEDKSEFKDTEGAMAKSQLERSMKYANMIYKIIDNVGKGGEVSFPAWVQTKMTKSMDYLQSVYNYLDGKDGLDDKFQENIDRNFRTYADDEGDDEGPVDENHSDIENEKLKKISAALKVASKMHLDQSKQIDKITADEEMEEGQKRYNQKDGVGKSKYVISYHDGKKKHKDGSDFFDMQIFRNKKDLAKFVNALHKGGYKYGFGESVNEDDMIYDPKTKSFKIKSGEQYVAYATKGNKVVDTVRDATYNDRLFSKFKKDMEKKGLNVFIDLLKNRKVVRQVYRTNESVNERLFVPSAFDKALDRMKFNQFTPNNIKKLSKKFKVDYKDAVEYIKQNKVINVANKPTMAEASKEAMGIAGFTGTRGVAVDDFIKKNKIDARKLFNFVRKGNLRDRMDFVTAIAGKPNNKFHKMIVSRFAESINERARFGVVAKYGGYEMVEKSNQSAFIISKSGKTVGQLKRTSKYLKDDIKRFIKMVKDGKIKNVKSYKFIESVNEAFVVAYGKREGSKPLKPAFAAYADKKMAQKFMADMKRDGFKVMMTQKKIKGIDEDKKQIVQLKKKVGKKEIKFYDALSKLEKKMGKKKYRDFLVKSLKDFKVNGNHYDYRTNAAAEEKLFQLAK